MGPNANAPKGTTNNNSNGTTKMTSNGKNNAPSPPPAAPRPSDARRKMLTDQLAVPVVSNFFPIERYYEAAQTAYDMTIDTYNADMLDDAYLYGKRYCTFCLEAIPEHNYYMTPKYRPALLKHTKQVTNVLTLLENITERMDAEEIEFERTRQQEEEQRRQYEEKLRQQQFEQLQHRIAQQKKSAESTKKQDVQLSALQKLALLSQTNNNQSNNDGTQRIRKDPSGDKDDVAQQQQPTSDLSSLQPLLPPPLLPPPPAYQQVVGDGTKQDSFKINLPIQDLDDDGSGRPNSRTSSSAASKPTKPRSIRSSLVPQPSKTPIVPLRQLQEKYAAQYYECQKVGKIQVSSLDTFQGRVYDSTNGCTVISALVAASHLRQEITNAAISTIIDQKAGPLLREIRGKLGLSGHALIIPSDVHDHFVDKNIFLQNQFVGVAGGNILDRNHYGEFLKMLAVGNDGTALSTRSSATLFFREHVISIVKIPVRTPSGTYSAYYDLIDSLPNHRTGKATRTRCNDVASLEIVLQWYATHKLSPTVVDRQPWDDTMADIDPRVFQGFVWMNPKQ